jgi:hypothetical protein
LGPTRRNPDACGRTEDGRAFLQQSALLAQRLRFGARAVQRALLRQEPVGEAGGAR